MNWFFFIFLLAYDIWILSPTFGSERYQPKPKHVAARLMVVKTDLMHAPKQIGQRNTYGELVKLKIAAISKDEIDGYSN